MVENAPTKTALARKGITVLRDLRGTARASGEMHCKSRIWSTPLKQVEDPSRVRASTCCGQSMRRIPSPQIHFPATQRRNPL
eukprot:scaffold43995_cov28-Tisochrysis_lutea.AAC.3